MAEDKESTVRNEDRHSHVGLRLQYRRDEKWEYLEALGWNEVGFSFYHTHDINEPVLELKRGITRFQGTIVWRLLNTDDEVVLAALLHELIFNRAKEVTKDAALRARLTQLIRAPGMLVEKRKILASLGLSMTDAQFAEMITQRKLERSMFHFGVKVESEAWGDFVKSALNISSVVISLEKVSDAFVKK